MLNRHMQDKGISEKHQQFLEYWLESNNITQSAIKAGYSKKTAGVRGSQLLKDPRSIDYINKRKQMIEERQDNLIAKTDEVLAYLTRVMRGEEKDAFGLDVSIADRTKAALELNRVLRPVQQTAEKVVIIDGITRDNKSET